MKELSTEEKAKRYDEAIERAKGAHNSAKSDKENGVIDKITEYTIQLTETIFPELRESEDEQIKKRIIQSLHGDVLDIEETNKAIAWLEKQAEQTDIANKEYWRGYREGKQEILDKYAELEKQGGQKLYVNDNAKEMFIKALERVEEQNSKGYKLTDCDKNSWWEDFKTYTSEQNLANSAKTCKVESIFEVGKWIVANESKYTFLVKRGAPRFQAENTNGDIYSFYLLPNGEEEYHLWTIEDAKDGDVLVASDGSIFIYKNQRDNGVVHYVAVTSYNDLVINENDYSWERKDVCHPATKDEQTILFERIKEAGYEWNAETKELKKTKQTIEIPFGAKDSELQEATYHIPEGYHAEINGNEVVIKKGKQKSSKN